jgi:hypothetical protein
MSVGTPPATVSVPDSTGNKPTIAFNKLDFPAPLGPTNEVTAPIGNANDASRRTE